MTDIILACCILHNFLCGIDSDDTLDDEVDLQLNEREDESMFAQIREVDYRLDCTIRNVIEEEMWRDYQNS